MTCWRTPRDAMVRQHARCQRTGAAAGGADPARLAALVWTALHGQAGLRMDRPQFPWPPLDEAITELVTRLVSIRTS
jgi:hypothetical protein